MRPHPGPCFATDLRHELNTGCVITIAKKNLLAAITPLGDVVRIKRNNNASHPGYLVTSL